MKRWKQHVGTEIRTHSLNEHHLGGLFGMDDYFGKNKTKQLFWQEFGGQTPFPIL